MWDHLAQLLAATVLLLVAELGRRVHGRRKANRSDPPPAEPITKAERPRELRTQLYAQRPAERCRLTRDCVLVRGHDGPCYLTSWLFDGRQRQRLRRLRGEPEGE